MFVRDLGRELEVRDLPPGRAVFLGTFEDGVNTYWLLIDSGEVWMLRGYDSGGGHQYGLVNSSVAGLQNRARQCDPRVFEDEGSWWSRVFEEVELGVLVPEDQ